MVLEGQVSYRQVGTNKSLGRVATQKRRRVRPHRSTPSIPSKFETTLHFGRSERNGFGGCARPHRHRGHRSVNLGSVRVGQEFKRAGRMDADG